MIEYILDGFDDEIEKIAFADKSFDFYTGKLRALSTKSDKALYKNYPKGASTVADIGNGHNRMLRLKNGKYVYWSDARNNKGKIIGTAANNLRDLKRMKNPWDNLKKMSL